MSEPPDEPSDGLSDEERAELEDFFNSEYFGELADDMLLDEAGRGEDHRTVFDEMPDEEWELRDHLADIKEQTEDEPVPELVSVEEAAKAIAEAKKKYDEAKAAKDQPTQGDEPMAIADDAQQVAQIGNDETASQAMEQAIRALSDAIGSLNSATEKLTSVGQNLQAAGEAAADQASRAGGLLGGDSGQALAAQGQALGQAISDALSKIAMVDIPGAQQNLQGVDLATLSGQIQTLRSDIKAAAQKHQG